MTNFEKLASSKTAMAYWMMCPYGVEDEMCKDMCPNSNCIDCCLEWLDTVSYTHLTLPTNSRV